MTLTGADAVGVLDVDFGVVKSRGVATPPSPQPPATFGWMDGRIRLAAVVNGGGADMCKVGNRHFQTDAERVLS